MNSLAEIAVHCGKYQEAEAIHVEVMKTRKRLFGVNHLDTMTSMSNIALVYEIQVKLEKAEELGLR